jgi:hypothetical protein
LELEMQKTRDSRRCAGFRDRVRHAGRAAGVSVSASSGIKLAIGDVARRTDGRALDKAAAGDGCCPCADGCAAKGLFAQRIAAGRKGAAKGKDKGCCSDGHVAVPFSCVCTPTTQNSFASSALDADDFVISPGTKAQEKRGSKERWVSCCP